MITREPQPNTAFSTAVSGVAAEVTGSLSRDRALERLRDWVLRVNALYADIERGLAESGRYRAEREGEHRSFEELAQRAGLTAAEVPTVPLLRILEGTEKRALILPRGLWVVGTNGRLDVRVFARRAALGSPERRFHLIDRSEPFVPPAKWELAPADDSFNAVSFTVNELIKLLDAASS